MSRGILTRRSFVAGSSMAAVLAASADSSPTAFETPPETRQATGIRVGEVTDGSALVWTRLTAHSERNDKGLVIPGRAVGKKKTELAKVMVPTERLEGACPAASGRIRVRYGTREDLADAVATDWAEVDARNDGIRLFRLSGLKPGTRYYLATETTGPGGTPVHAPFRGRFRTAPAADRVADVRFCVMTCQGYPDRGHKDGHEIYKSMGALDPAFACLTGDLVYYDNDEPRAVNLSLARYHWERMFSLPRLVEFTRNHATYWLKDDHDTLDNDSWPGRTMGDFTFARGQTLFREQSPTPDGPSYRTVRWGRDLQLWFTDGRDFRSPNDIPDGPAKTIWGAEQKAWFKRTVKASDATWKVLVSPTPLVGPDRKGKNDNHANAGFRHEGDEIRGWLKEHAPDDFFVVCGDRHWQYHSVHPGTGLREFGVGAASDEHAGGTPGEDKAYHRFHRVKGGFLQVDVTRRGSEARIEFRLNGRDGKTGHLWAATKTVG